MTALGWKIDEIRSLKLALTLKGTATVSEYKQKRPYEFLARVLKMQGGYYDAACVFTARCS